MDKIPDKLKASLIYTYQNEKNSIDGTIHFNNGEFVCNKFKMLGGELMVVFSYGDDDYSFPVQQLGGKYFVSNQKEIPLFSNVQLFKKMDFNIKPKMEVKKNKI